MSVVSSVNYQCGSKLDMSMASKKAFKNYVVKMLVALQVVRAHSYEAFLALENPN